MNRNLTINFTIPLSEDKWGDSCIIFEQWIPETESDVIVVDLEGKTVRIYADKSCGSSMHDVTDELIDFIYAERESPRKIHHGLNPEEAEYLALCFR